MRLNKMMKVLASLACVFLLLGFYPAYSVAKEKYEERFDKTVDLAKDGQVKVKNISGDIEVRSWDKSQVKIDALKTSSASTYSRAEENAKKVTIEVNKVGNTLEIKVEYPKTRGSSLNVSIDFRLTIPDKASVKVNSVSGNIFLEKIGGVLDAHTVSGNIDVMKADKGVDCESVSGDLELEAITGDAYLNAVSGDITLTQIKGSINANTVSGDVELRDVSEAKVVEAKTISGTTSYEGNINPSGRYTLKSHSGDIEMTIPSDSRFSLEAKTFSGTIDTDFDITVSGKISRRKISGEVNGGGAVVKLSTFSGDVELIKQ